jgi:lipoyl(octanoyl) transferase
VAVSTLIVRQLGLQDYAQTWQAMTRFTNERQAETPDEFWLVQHPPVFTQGQAGKPEHVLFRGDIPLVHTDRGGQVTYHGPGQLVAYPLLDLRRCKLGVRDLVTLIEQTLVNVLAHYQILAKAKADAPGVYVDGAKIASLGLRVRRGCSFHGLSLNVDMDLTPFSRINPCGYQGLPMTQMREFLDSPPDFSDVQLRLAEQFAQNLGYESCTIRAG